MSSRSEAKAGPELSASFIKLTAMIPDEASAVEYMESVRPSLRGRRGATGRRLSPGERERERRAAMRRAKAEERRKQREQEQAGERVKRE